MQRRDLLAGLCGVGLAGCLRLQGGGSTGTPAGTTDPPIHERSRTDTPTATEAVDVEYPTGVTAEGIEPLAAGAHASELLTTSYTVEFRMENVSRASVYEAATIRGDGRRALLREPHRKDLALLFATDRRWWRATHEGRTVYGTNTLGVHADAITRRRPLEQLLAAGSFGPPETVQQDGERRFRSSADGLASPDPLVEQFDGNNVSSVESFTGEVVIDGAGIIRSLTAETEIVWDDRLNLVQYEYATSDVGSTAPPDPEWLATAQDQAPRVSTELTNERNVLVVTNEGPGAVPAGARAILHPTGSYGDADSQLLSVELAAGEQLWLWREGGRTRVERSAPADGAPATLDGEFVASLDVGVANYMKRPVG